MNTIVRSQHSFRMLRRHVASMAAAAPEPTVQIDASADPSVIADRWAQLADLTHDPMIEKISEELAKAAGIAEEP
eukprot:CAMPEP_0198114720 /NCGR_PEP_ID=MMETSP1442-20131203/6024_1 /TAXON_ID= /ORGANISM="Craspedostauros australis, Strain CCMP3328" /LENGTH=74 /DNA_ID=CAMNT_0043772097 /DNA_START=121 /DNA_END=345 /DNA_ORIENTATION=+